MAFTLCSLTHLNSCVLADSNASNRQAFQMNATTSIPSFMLWKLYLNYNDNMFPLRKSVFHDCSYISFES